MEDFDTELLFLSNTLSLSLSLSVSHIAQEQPGIICRSNEKHPHWIVSPLTENKLTLQSSAVLWFNES